MKRVEDVVLGTDAISYERWRRKYGVKAYAVAAPKAVFVDGKAAHFTYADGFVSFEAGTASEAVIEF